MSKYVATGREQSLTLLLDVLWTFTTVQQRMLDWDAAQERLNITLDIDFFLIIFFEFLKLFYLRSNTVAMYCLRPRILKYNIGQVVNIYQAQHVYKLPTPSTSCRKRKGNFKCRPILYYRILV